MHDPLGKEQQTQFDGDAIVHELTDITFAQEEDVCQVLRVVVGVDAADDTGSQDDAREKEEFGFEDHLHRGHLGSGVAVTGGSGLTGAVMLVSLDLDLIGDQKHNRGDQDQHGRGSGVEHDKVVLSEPVVKLVDSLSADVVSDGAEHLLIAVVVLAGGGIGFQETQNDGIDDGESAGREDGRGSAEQVEVNGASPGSGLEQGESHQAQTQAVHDDTEGCDLTIAASPVGQGAPVRTGHDSDSLPEEGCTDSLGVHAPGRLQILVVEAVRGVDEPVQEEVHGLGNQKVWVRIAVLASLGPFFVFKSHFPIGCNL